MKDDTSLPLGEHPRFERTSTLLMDDEEYEFWQSHDPSECETCSGGRTRVRFREFGPYMAAQQGAYAAMPDTERQELHEWESEHLNGRDVAGTSDWPGWQKYIGVPPWYDREPKPRRKKKPISNALRKEVFQRDAYRCVACGSWHDLTADHIVAESKGGAATLDNLQTMCRSCNCRKGAR